MKAIQLHRPFFFTVVLTTLLLAGVIGFQHFRPLSEEEMIRRGLVVSKNGALCSNNLKLFDTAKQQWALEHRKTTNDPPPTLDNMRDYLGRGPTAELPECPCGGRYTPGPLDVPAKCSLSLWEHTRARYEAAQASHPPSR